MDRELNKEKEDSWKICFCFCSDCVCGIIKELPHKHLEDYSALAHDKYLNFDAIFRPST